MKKALAYELSDDPTRELNVKILETLAKIGNSEAKEILKDCLESPSMRIREMAELLLVED